MTQLLYVLVALVLGKSFIMLKIIAENKKKSITFIFSLDHVTYTMICNHDLKKDEILIKLLRSFNMMKLLVILSTHELKY